MDGPNRFVRLLRVVDALKWPVMMVVGALLVFCAPALVDWLKVWVG